MLKSLVWSLAQGKYSYRVFIVITVIIDSEQSLQCWNSHLHWMRASTGGWEMVALVGMADVPLSLVRCGRIHFNAGEKRVCVQEWGKPVSQPVHQKPHSCLSSYQAHELQSWIHSGKPLIHTILPPYLERDS